MNSASWSLPHTLAVLAAILICGVGFIYTGDADLFLALGGALGLGLAGLAWFQLRGWWAKRP